jgi:hypothetical protein
VKVQKAYEITNARISFVSLVDKAANKKQFLITKAEAGSANFSLPGRVLKMDAEQHHITGIVYTPMEEDTQGSYMTAAEIEKAAYWFAKNGNKIDLQHNFVACDTAAVVETWVAKSDTEIDGEPIKKGTWLMTVEVTDDIIWQAVQKGDITGFSMGGIGTYSEEDTPLAPVTKSEETPQKWNIFKQLGALLGFGVVQKGDVAELYSKAIKVTEFWRAWDALQDVLAPYSYAANETVLETDEEKIRTALEEFSAIITQVLTEKGGITKAVSSAPIVKHQQNKEETPMTKEDLQQITEAVVKAMQSQEIPATQVTLTAEPIAAPITLAQVREVIQEEIQKAINPSEPTADDAPVTLAAVTEAVQKALEPMLKSRGLPSNLNGAASIENQADPHYLAGLL